ncbi:DUF4935 domain-containing protein [Pectobacterium brasiliense]|uniref:PIN domain-containing protein n=1 Tax=Pectobacterium brasiliense TaxID=180957 RepID=UPI00057CB3DD|nr:PIN domain-containing protein [Pectobacterium brasiliense]KHT42619.1 hypothetical protein RD02_03605 [Pectobacterium brasiliense]MBN3116909.1 DUF4935 domain-containing protein [Pectobacterium brasiliense]MDY4333475.1 PIN domain-containing protein [Pectobacterium brasiliense]
MSEQEYTAITLDTSIFDGNGLRLEQGLLGKMRQFKTIPIIFVLTDVTVSELTHHLEEKMKASKFLLEKALEDSKNHLLIPDSDLNSFKEKFSDLKDFKDAALKRVQMYIDMTGAIVLDTNQYVSIAEIRDAYFSNQSPFTESGSKKNEFPDAISLIALKNWAEKNEQIVCAVSKDKDWGSFCDEVDDIDYINDLSKALDYFNRETVSRLVVEKLAEAIDSDEDDVQNFKVQLESMLEGAVERLTLTQEAASSLAYEGDGVEIKFKQLHSIATNFKIIEAGDDYLIVETLLNVELDIEGVFSLYHYDSFDKDYIRAGSVTSTINDSYDLSVLLTLAGDFSDFSEIEINSLEVVSNLGTVHFGFLEPYYEPDYD